MRFVCISDVHNLQEELRLPKGDVLLIAGDVTMGGRTEELDRFVFWAGAQDFKHTVLIAGNHDFAFEDKDRREDAKFLCDAAGVIYLQDEDVILGGFRIWGSPWQPWFYDWAFNLPRGKQLADKWAMIPDDTDILVTHGPPKGIRDTTREGEEVGCSDLRNRVEKLPNLKLHVFGHIHEGYGVSKHGPTTFVNASVVNRNYQVVHPAVEIEL